MKEQNRDDFYEGPPLEEEKRWHRGAVVGADDTKLDAPAQAGREESLVQLDIPARGAYPLPEVTERPHETADGIAPTALTRDPSLSRAVDRAAAGAGVEEAGYDRSIEGDPAGPLAPEPGAEGEADDRPAGGGS